jgi:hypothetical protein
MATSPTTKSALLSGAAKDDAVGLNGDFTFTIQDLLGNDPGGAAKVDVNKQFFFGDTAADQADQAGYLAAHGITDNGDGTYTINSDALDSFSYFVQIGNKGTWSQADVDVTAPPVEEPCVPHLGDALFTENFDNYQETQKYYDPADSDVFVFGTVDLNAASGWTNPSNVELVATGYGGIESTSGDAWLDTQNSPGQIDISHTFTDTTAAVGGKTSVLSFDIGIQDLTYLGNHYATDTDASFQFQIDGKVVADFDWSDFNAANVMQHFEVDITEYAAAGDTHTLSLVDTSPTSDYTGFSVDSIHIDDWVLC